MEREIPHSHKEPHSGGSIDSSKAVIRVDKSQFNKRAT